MKQPVLSIHGAAQTVTGSCFQLTLGGRHILVDCGLFQGSRSLEALNHEPFAFHPATINAVLLTHAHLDHSGLLPRLASEGFRGSIWCTEATGDLLGEMLPDAARIQEGEAERRNARADRADQPPITPLYTMADAERTLAMVRVVELQESFVPAPGFEARLWNAGHILGSASVEVAVNNLRMLFSGDLGPEHKSFHLNPVGPHDLDHVICESTYGDRERDDVTISQRREMLEKEVKTALGRGGNLIIPVFALERTQELLLDLASLINSGRLSGTSVFIDSPLASRTTKIFRRHRLELEDLGSGEVFDHPAFHFVESVEASIGLNRMSGAIILAASGMCEAGRIRHHLRFNLPRSDSTVLFVGFQAQGTLGRTIMDGARRVRMSGQDIAVRAQVRRIESYSAHADRSELLAWIEARQPIKGSLFLTHGESGAIEGLRTELGPRLDSLVIPEIGERYELQAGEPARRIATGRVDLRPVLKHDWQNAYADLTVNLKHELEAIEDREKRMEAIAKMRNVLKDYRALRKHQRSKA